MCLEPKHKLCGDPSVNCQLAAKLERENEDINPCSYVEQGAKQSFRDECDINKIVSRYEDIGIYPLPKSSPMYGDFTEMNGYEEALQKVVRAREYFDQLPAELRERFANDPARMLDFVTDPKNVNEAVKLGLLELKDANPDPETKPITVRGMRKVLREQAESVKK